VRILPADAPPNARAPHGGMFLYLLVDPRASHYGEVRWVGVATFPALRLRRHSNPEARDWRLYPEKSAWVEALCAEGYYPVMLLLAVASKEYVLTLEDALIDLLRAQGANLFNRTRRPKPPVVVAAAPGDTLPEAGA